MPPVIVILVTLSLDFHSLPLFCYFVRKLRISAMCSITELMTLYHVSTSNLVTMPLYLLSKPLNSPAEKTARAATRLQTARTRGPITIAYCKPTILQLLITQRTRNQLEIEETASLPVRPQSTLVDASRVTRDAVLSRSSRLASSASHYASVCESTLPPLSSPAAECFQSAICYAEVRA